jgi:hypothetical protein
MTRSRRSFTQVDNEFLDRMLEIGVGPAAVLLQLLRHRNRRTGQCNAGTFRFGEEAVMCDLCFASLTPPASNCHDNPPP